MKNIYCVEDDLNIRELMEYTLRQTGFQTKGFESAADFFEALKNDLPDLILLDIMLPDMDGMEILKELKNSSKLSEIPVIMLTAKSGRMDKIKGLDSGADDYIPKPFRMMELVSRIKALLRRSGKTGQADKEFTIDGLYVSQKKHQVKVGDREVVLTLKEFELLLLLLSNPGIVFTRAQLLDKIWGYQFDGESRTVDVHIRSLRRKLGACGQLIETVRGIGYKIGESEL